MSKQDRIHHNDRIKKNRSKGFWGRESVNGKSLGIALHTPAICSCPMCGNPRKYSGERTIQEKRLMQNMGD